MAISREVGGWLSGSILGLFFELDGLRFGLDRRCLESMVYLFGLLENDNG
jgi:hypothetical protein